MRQFVALEVDEDVAAEEAVVEDEIDVVVVVVEGEPFLPGLEEKTFSEFEEEVFELVDDGGFQLALGIGGAFIETEEFEHVGVLDQVSGALDDLAFAGQAPNLVLVATEGEALI